LPKAVTSFILPPFSCEKKQKQRPKSTLYNLWACFSGGEGTKGDSLGVNGCSVSPQFQWYAEPHTVQLKGIAF
jgi:hypothetical protein